MGFEPTTASLEGWNSTTELRPPPANPPTLRHSLCTSPSPRIRHDGTSLNALSRNRARSPRATGLIWTQFGGQARVRTLEAIRQQIYSLPPLSTWVPAREGPISKRKRATNQFKENKHQSVSFSGSENEVSPTMHSSPAKRQGWIADKVRVDLASKAADFICDAFYCQGGMFYAGTILRLR